MSRYLRLLATAALLAAACAPALRASAPGALAAPPSGGPGAAGFLHDAEVAWSRRAEPGQAEAAQDLYLRAAQADPAQVQPVLGAMRAMTYRLEHERGLADRAGLAGRQVELGQLCQQRAPADPACGYRLALALGQQARERPATGRDAVRRMVPLLRRAIAAAPDLDAGGPERALALVLLRAPAWPVGPGDAQAGLDQARAAVQHHPEVAQNQLVLGEALEKNGEPEEARAAYRRALEAADAAAQAGDPEAARTRDEARAGLERSGPR